MHVIDEAPLSVDLDDRDPLAVLRLEPRVAVDGDLAQFETELVARLGHDAAGCLTEMAARRGVESDFGVYG